MDWLLKRMKTTKDTPWQAKQHLAGTTETELEQKVGFLHHLRQLRMVAGRNGLILISYQAKGNKAKTDTEVRKCHLEEAPFKILTRALLRNYHFLNL